MGFVVWWYTIFCTRAERFTTITINYMEEMNKKMDGNNMCNCSSPSWAHRHARRLVIAALVVIFSFWVGMQLGEIKGYMMASGMMSENRGGMMMYKIDRDVRMMPVQPVLETAPQE